MHFSHLNHGGNKASKFALIAGLHVVLGILFVQGLNVRSLVLPKPQDVTVTLTPDHTDPPPQQVEPPKPRTDLPPPQLVVPPLETVLPTPPAPAPVTATTDADPAPNRPAVADPGPAVPAAQAGAQPAAPARLRTAVLADAKACALPDYPARAARLGETGTTILALLVGTDGRVTSARVERSSGSRELDRAALAALSLCRFQPATNNGVPEAAWAQLGYVWTLD